LACPPLTSGDPISRDRTRSQRTVGAVGGRIGASPGSTGLVAAAGHPAAGHPEAAGDSAGGVPSRRGPTLIAVAHGSRDPGAAAVIEAVLARVRALRPGLTARAAYLEITSPALTAALTDEPGPVVAVPLLLATGYHATVDVPTVVAAVRPDAAVGRVLGPHPLLAEALHDRLRQAGWRRGDAVVLAAAGSTDPAAAVATESQARLLAARIDSPVTVGYASAGEPSVPAAVTAARRAGMTPVTVASYLLAPGVFQAGLSAAGADLVSDPLGDHDAVVRLVLLRYDEARSAG
jgi:sirohydrochlorin ferrochelatase